MLITRPNHDDTTKYLYYWSKLIIHQAKKLKRAVTDLSGKKANYQEFIKVLKKNNPLFIIINGHGNKKAVTGFNNEILVQSGVNESVFDKRIIFARSCQSAATLGKSCVKKGTKTYIGYTEDFVFFIEQDTKNNPLEDETAGLFLAPSNYIAIALLNGEKTGEANDKSKEMYQKNMQKLMTSETPEKDRELIPFLRWNMVHQVCLGDDKAKL